MLHLYLLSCSLVRRALFLVGVVQRRLQIVNISWGPRPNDAVGMHVAAWVLGESLMHLATIWPPADVRPAMLSITVILVSDHII